MIDSFFSQDLFEEIKCDFSSLWSSRRIGSTVEIVTPYMDLRNNVIVVYLTQRGDKFVVTDGGRASVVAKEEDVDLLRRKNFHYKDLLAHYEMSDVYHDNLSYCYKSTKDRGMISSLIYDVVHFYRTLVDSMYMESMFSDQESHEKYFSTQVRNIIKEKILGCSDKYEVCSIDSLKGLRFNCFVRKRGTDKIWSAMAICGKDFDSLRNSVSRAKFGFEYVMHNRNIFPGMRLASIIDHIPPTVKQRDGATLYLDDMNRWPTCYGSDNYLMQRFARFRTVDDFFEGRVAS
jgi:hypothetical protein